MSEPYPSGLLNADHLAALEEKADTTVEVPHPEHGQLNNPVPRTMEEAVDRLRRIGYWQRRLVEIDTQAGSLIAPLQAEIDKIRHWAAKEHETPLRRIAFHEAALTAYYRANPPKQGKTLKLPGGRISSRGGTPEWIYNDATLVAWLEQNRPELVRRDPVANKAELRKVATVMNGRVVVAETGELVEGVTAVDRLPTYTVEIDP